jgi:CubicO group peptidase (beta-lactamase class C family)
VNHPARVALLLCFLPAFAIAADESSFATQVDGIFQPLYDQRGPGCVVAVARPGKSTFVRAYGLADVENLVPLTASAKFDIGSISKQFTATAVLLLAQRHQIDLRDDIRKHLPELPVYATRITVDDLLHQTSGLRDAYEILKIQGRQIYEDLVTNADVLAVAAAQRGVNFGPGDEYSYSNTNYLLLGAIVERVSRQSLGSFLQKEIFDPLHMTNTTLRASNRALIRGRARPYFKDAEGTVTLSNANDEVSGDGNIFTSARDLTTWNENLPAGTIGGEALWKQLTTPGHLRDGSETPYGAGLAISSRRGVTIFSHGGASAGYHAYSLLIPERRISVAVLCNVRDSRPGTSPSRLAQRVTDLIIGSQAAAVTSGALQKLQPVSVDRGHYRGTFFNSRDGAVIAIRMHDGSLMMMEDFFGRTEQPLTFTNDNEAHVDDITLKFDIDDGVASKLARTDGDGSAIYQRVSDLDGDNAIDSGREFAGLYRSHDARADWEIENRGGTLYLTVPRHAPEALVPVFQDAFYAEQWTLVFTRSSGRVDGLNVVNERVRSVRFDRINAPAPD